MSQLYYLHVYIICLCDNIILSGDCIAYLLKLIIRQTHFICIF